MVTQSAKAILLHIDALKAAGYVELDDYVGAFDDAGDDGALDDLEKAIQEDDAAAIQAALEVAYEFDAGEVAEDATFVDEPGGMGTPPRLYVKWKKEI